MAKSVNQGNKKGKVSPRHYDPSDKVAPSAKGKPKAASAYSPPKQS